MYTDRVLILTGAPTIDQVVRGDTTANDRLGVDAFLPSFRWLLGANRCQSNTTQISSNPVNVPPGSRPPVWRLLPITAKQHLRTDFSPGSWLKAPVSFHEDSGEAEADKSYLTVTGSFYPSQSFQSVDDATEKTEEDDFIEKSFALHDEIHTSQLTASSSYPASDDEAESVASSRRNQPSDRLGLTVPHLTDISKLPSAAHILHIIPQTVTVDLIVGVIAIHPIRRVTIRKTNRETDLAEVLFGDETTAGFSVTFWVKPESPRRKPKSAVTASEDTEDAMRREVQTLRVGDIALVRNVALSQFRGKVHGQSLGRRQPKASARWGTSVSLIWRPGVSRDNLEVFSTGLKDTGDTEAGKRSHLLAAKVTRVRDWARHFIAPPDRDWQYKRKRKASTLDDAERFFMKEQLPLDDSLC